MFIARGTSASGTCSTCGFRFGVNTCTLPAGAGRGYGQHSVSSVMRCMVPGCSELQLGRRYFINIIIIILAMSLVQSSWPELASKVCQQGATAWASAEGFRWLSVSPQPFVNPQTPALRQSPLSHYPQRFVSLYHSFLNRCKFNFYHDHLF